MKGHTTVRYEGFGGIRYRLRIPDDVPDVFMAKRIRFIEHGPQEHGGDLFHLDAWEPVPGERTNGPMKVAKVSPDLEIEGPDGAVKRITNARRRPA